MIWSAAHRLICMHEPVASLYALTSFSSGLNIYIEEGINMEITHIMFTKFLDKTF